MEFVFVVYHQVIGDSGSIFVYAVCRSERKAKIARNKAAGFSRKGRYFTLDPECNPYATELRILKVALDRVYSLGVLSQVDRRNLERLEVIS